MNYCIFAIDDRRKEYTDKIRSAMGESFWFNEQPVWTVDGRSDTALAEAQQIHTFRVNWQGTGNVPTAPRRGQLGIWYSVLNATEFIIGRRDPILTFEDDAILHPYFHRLFWDVTSRLPQDTDAFTLFVPRDQDDVYAKRASELWVGQGICRAYQRYGGVSMLWTPQGAMKFRRLLRRDGIQDQWDNTLYKYAQSGEMNVYTQTPSRDVLVSITGREDSIVQESEFL